MGRAAQAFSLQRKTWRQAACLRYSGPVGGPHLKTRLPSGGRV